jgi:hypothetical protein
MIDTLLRPAATSTMVVRIGLGALTTASEGTRWKSRKLEVPRHHAPRVVLPPPAKKNSHEMTKTTVVVQSRAESAQRLLLLRTPSEVGAWRPLGMTSWTRAGNQGALGAAHISRLGSEPQRHGADPALRGGREVDGGEES